MDCRARSRSLDVEHDRHDRCHKEHARDREDDGAAHDSLQVFEMEPERGLEHETGQQGEENDVGRDREAHGREARDEQAERNEGHAERQPHPAHRERDEDECGEQGDDDLDGVADRGIMDG